jgi:hypothetical protein
MARSIFLGSTLKELGSEIQRRVCLISCISFGYGYYVVDDNAYTVATGAKFPALLAIPVSRRSCVVLRRLNSIVSLAVLVEIIIK